MKLTCFKKGERVKRYSKLFLNNLVYLRYVDALITGKNIVPHYRNVDGNREKVPPQTRWHLLSSQLHQSLKLFCYFLWRRETKPNKPNASIAMVEGSGTSTGPLAL